MRLIRDGLVDRDGVPGLARRLGYSERQLHRILLAEIGTGAATLARAQRADTARSLIESTDLTLAEIALAAGFGSIRQFNDTLRQLYGVTPTRLRHRGPGSATKAGVIRLRLAAKPPFDGTSILQFLGRHEIGGLERVRGASYTRTLSLPRGHGLVTLTTGPTGLDCRVRLADLRDLVPAVGRCRRLFDLDTDPRPIVEALRDAPIVGALVRAEPGVRVPGTVDGFELAVRTIIREGNDPVASRASGEQLIARHGTDLKIADDDVWRLFPTPDVLAYGDLEGLGLDERRTAAIRSLAVRIADGDIRLDAGADLDEAISELLEVPGIGPWIASYIAMRALGDPDAFLYECARVDRALRTLGHGAEALATIRGRSEQWRPWRSYAVAHLWHVLDREDVLT
jgi:AraC family transcriptional regulator, regulatory protein of adaptative response / DNA-3-methyladenine glycosylase II